MHPDEDLSLKVLQLQCIIDAKDREISLLRSSYANGVEDPSGVTVQLHEEVKALQDQLTEKDAAVSLLQAELQQLSRGQSSPTDAGNHGSLSIHLPNGHAAPAFMLDEDEVLTLNVSGHECYVQRSTLLQVPGSKLCKIFELGSATPPSKDAKGRYFMPYQHEVFSVIIASLQALQQLGLSPEDTQWADRVRDRRLQLYTQRLLEELGIQELFHFPAASIGSGRATGASSDGTAVGEGPFSSLNSSAAAAAGVAAAAAAAAASTSAGGGAAGAGALRAVRTVRGSNHSSSAGGQVESPKRGGGGVGGGRNSPRRGSAGGKQASSGSGGVARERLHGNEAGGSHAGRPFGSGKPPGSIRTAAAAAPPGSRSHGKGSGSNNSSGNGAKPHSPHATGSAGNQKWLNAEAASAAVMSALSGPPEPHPKPGVTNASSAAAADLAREVLQGL